jgi:hypothetical protein
MVRMFQRNLLQASVFRCVRGIAKSVSVRMEQLGYQLAECNEIWGLRIFRKSVENIQVSFKSDKNNGYFKWRPMYILISPQSIFLRMRNVSVKICRKFKDTDFMFHNSPTPPENHAVYKKMWKKNGTARQATRESAILRKKMRFACRITKARTKTHTNNI